MKILDYLELIPDRKSNPGGGVYFLVAAISVKKGGGIAGPIPIGFFDFPQQKRARPVTALPSLSICSCSFLSYFSANISLAILTM